MASRGPDPADAREFRDEVREVLRTACSDLSWLLERGYSPQASLSLVGDRHQLTHRQRRAVQRCAVPDPVVRTRASRETRLRGQAVIIDGFNVLIVLERALAGGPVFVGRDGACRDIGGVHGTYRTVEETPAAVLAVRDWLHDHDVASVRWLLDRPVSNSGKLAGRIRALDPTWIVDVEDRVDPLLAESDAVVCSADGWVIDQSQRWNSLVRELVTTRISDAWVIDLRPDPERIPSGGL